MLNSCIQRVCPHARTRTPPSPQNLGAGPPRPALFGAAGFGLSFTRPPPTSPRPGGGFPTLGTGRRRGGAEPRRARSDCLFRSCARAARMGVFSPSTLARAPRPGASASASAASFASAAAAPFASAVKVVARTRSAMLPLASNGWLPVQLLPPRRSLVVAVVGQRIGPRPAWLRLAAACTLTAWLRLAAACTPGGARFVGLACRCP